MGATFLVCHGAWSAGWAWKKMHPLMNAAGQRLLTPTYTGLGERAHLANPSIDLETHIEDILNVIKYEDLRDVVLIGHSYGGMVATGVAGRARDGDGRAQIVVRFLAVRHHHIETVGSAALENGHQDFLARSRAVGGAQRALQPQR